MQVLYYIYFYFAYVFDMSMDVRKNTHEKVKY